MVIGDPAKGVTPTNVDNLSATGRRRVSLTEGPTVFVTRSDMEAMLRKEKEKKLICN